MDPQQEQSNPAPEALALVRQLFQIPRVGDTKARFRELDMSREVLTGSSVTLIIDLLFAVVFFAVLSCPASR